MYFFQTWPKSSWHIYKTEGTNVPNACTYLVTHTYKGSGGLRNVVAFLFTFCLCGTQTLTHTRLVLDNCLVFKDEIAFKGVI